MASSSDEQVAELERQVQELWASTQADLLALGDDVGILSELIQNPVPLVNGISDRRTLIAVTKALGVAHSLCYYSRFERYLDLLREGKDAPPIRMIHF